MTLIVSCNSVLIFAKNRVHMYLANAQYKITKNRHTFIYVVLRIFFNKNKTVILDRKTVSVMA